jgi:hypothetical protein
MDIAKGKRLAAPDWPLVDCERFGVEPDGPSSRWSTTLAESHYYARCRIRELEAEVERLQAVVDILPKTEDGVAVVPGVEFFATGEMRYANGARMRVHAAPCRFRLVPSDGAEFVGQLFSASSAEADQTGGGRMSGNGDPMTPAERLRAIRELLQRLRSIRKWNRRADSTTRYEHTLARRQARAELCDVIIPELERMVD